MNRIPTFLIVLYEFQVRFKQRIHHFCIPLFKPCQTTKVFCVGYAKTGTSTLTQALSLLGYRSVHWLRAGKEPKCGWVQCIKKCNYDAFADTPIISHGFFKLLDQEFPNSKFILLLRDTDSLLRSWKNYFRGSPLAMDSEQMRKKVKRYYERHNNEVLAHFEGKPDQLLVMNIFKGDGWEKLCPFLDKPIPDKPFPHKRKGNYHITRLLPFH